MEILAREIEAGIYREARMPTEAELGSRFAVSRITASRAMRELETLGLVVRRRGQGSFARGEPAGPAGTAATAPAAPPRTARTQAPQPPIEARSHASPGKGRAKRVDLILPYADYMGSELMEGAAELARKEGCALGLHLSGADPLVERNIIADLIAEGSEMTIAFPSGKRANSDAWIRLRTAGAALVFVDRRPLGLGGSPLVQSDHLGGGRSMVEFMLSRGHRRIAYLASDFSEAPSVEARYEGYCEALCAGGGEVDQDLVVELNSLGGPAQRPGIAPSSRMTPEETTIAAEKALASLLALPSPPTAIFAANDGLALVVSDLALRRGMVLPAQLGIGGFDDIFMASHAAVPLTTVRQDFRAIGREALRLSLSRGRGGRRTRDKTFPVELIVRGSIVRQSASARLPAGTADARR